MKRIYKKSGMVVWKDEKDKNNLCYFYSIGGFNWAAVEAMNKTENELGNFSSKYKAFRALQLHMMHMKKLGYTIEL